MNRRHFLGVCAGAGALSFLGLSRREGWERVERTSRALGADTSILVYHRDRVVAERAVAAAFEALAAVERELSLYQSRSGLCRLNRDGVLADPHPDLVRVLQAALVWSRRSGGAFDPTVQPLWSLHARGGAPAPGDLDAARERVDWRQVEVEAGFVRLGKGQSVTLNGIAQGFAADRALAVLRAHGIRHALVNAGELGGVGAKPGGQAWRVGIQHPREPEAWVALTEPGERFLATSGDYATRFSEDFSSHHIFDPKTGRSPESLASVSVLAPTGLEADAASTAMLVLGAERGLALAASRPGVDALLVGKDGSLRATRGFPRISAA